MDRAYKKIGILDHMGCGNMGDAAIQEAMIANIRARRPQALIVGFSLNPEDTKQRHNIVSYPIQWSVWSGPWRYDSATPPANALDPRPRLKSILKTYPLLYAIAKRILDSFRELAHLVRSYHVVKTLDLLVMSGGGQLCELWRGPWEQPYNVFKFCVLAKLSKTPLFIVDVGAGPLDHPLSKFFARWSVRLADYTSFRDVESQALIHDIGAKTTTHVYPDPAYAYDFTDYLTDRDRPPNKLVPKVGLNPMGFCDPRIWPRKDDVAYRRYLDKLVVFSSWLLAQSYNLAVFTSDISVDHYAIEDLRERLLIDGSPDGNSKVVYLPVLNLKELFLQMSTFDFIITSKFHGVIFSHLLTKPVIALSYHPKIDHLMRAVGHHQYCLDIEHFEVDSLIETFNLLVHNRDQLRSQFRKTAAAYADALHVQFDDLFLERKRVR